MCSFFRLSFEYSLKNWCLECVSFLCIHNILLLVLRCNTRFTGILLLSTVKKTLKCYYSLCFYFMANLLANLNFVAFHTRSISNIHTLNANVCVCIQCTCTVILCQQCVALILAVYVLFFESLQTNTRCSSHAIKTKTTRERVSAMVTNLAQCVCRVFMETESIRTKMNSH